VDRSALDGRLVHALVRTAAGFEEQEESSRHGRW
jgi:hypothetical protein